MGHRPARTRLVVMGAGVLAVALAAPALASAATAKAKWGDFDRVAGYNTLVPNTLTVSKGDKVQFAVFGFHTVVIPGKGGTVPPLMTPGSDLNPATPDPAGTPYWWGGATPKVLINIAAAAPSGGTVANGRKTVNSGLLNGNAPKFTVTFPKTGTFTVRCAVHPNMRGTVRVVARSTDTPAKRAARAARERASQQASVKALIKKATAATGTVIAIGPGTKRAQDYAFRPAKRTVPVGSTVTFRMAGRNEFHTVTFGPTAYVNQVARAFFPSGPADLALGSEAVYPTDPPAAGVPVVTPTAHGNGFVNSGGLNDRGAGSLPKTFTVSFPQAGTYKFSCLVHPEMKGTITVG